MINIDKKKSYPLFAILPNERFEVSVSTLSDRFNPVTKLE